MIIALSSDVTVMHKIADTIWRDKSIVYIDTASNWQEWDKTWLDNQTWAIKNEYSDFHRYSIEWKSITEFQTDLAEYDIIHIWWGRTAYLLHHILQTWFDIYLRKIQSSKVIIGSSAGAKILWEDIGHVEPLDDFTGMDLKDSRAVWLLNFDIWAHFWKEKYRKKYNEVLDIAYKNSPSWIYLSDNSYLISTTEWVKIYKI